MTKKIKLYLESSALWNLYYEETGAKLIEYCLDNTQIGCITSIWSQLEIERGIKKRENLQELTPEEAKQLQLFIETDSNQLVSKKKLELCPILPDYLSVAKRYIRNYNLFASDALHLASATIQSCEAILVDDYHFKRLDKTIQSIVGLKIIPATKKIEVFKREIL